ncbi:MAG: MauE/DoxX family redox-associated membrane protein [Chloroflexota bacterium]
MDLLKNISLIIMSLFYIAAGINHFRSPKFYLRIIPPWMPKPEWLNWISGAAEVVLGIMLLFPPIRPLAAWGVIALLIAVFPANIYHLTSKGAGMKIPMWTLWLRLPIQGLFILWAYWYT